MHYPYDRKTVAVTPPAAIIDNASATTATVDTLGYAMAVFRIHFGAMDIAAVALKVQESDDSGMAGAADVVGTRFATDNNDTGAASTLPVATDDNHFFEIVVDCRGRKRYLDLVATLGDGAAGSYFTCWCELYRPQDAPRTALEAGITQRLIV